MLLIIRKVYELQRNPVGSSKLDGLLILLVEDSQAENNKMFKCDILYKPLQIPKKNSDLSQTVYLKPYNSSKKGQDYVYILLLFKKYNKNYLKIHVYPPAQP